MYQQSRTRFYVLNFKCIVLLFASCCLSIVNSHFFLSTLKLTSPTQSFTVPYNKTLPGTQLAFAYFIECGTIYQNNLKLTHQQNQTSVLYDRFSIKFTIYGVASMNNVDEYLQVKVLVSTYSSSVISLSMISTPPSQRISIPLPCTYDPSMLIKSLQPQIFPTVLPMTQTHSLNQTHLTIVPTLSPSGITSITFSILIITRQYQSLNIGLVIQNLQLGNLGWIILFNNDIFFNPGITNMLVGITGYQMASNPIINMLDQVNYQFNFPLYPDQRSVYIFYNLYLPTPTIFTTCIFIFNQNFHSCLNGGFLSYTQLYYDSPLSCQPCHMSCLTCTSTNYSLSLTDEECCLSCSVFKYIQINDVLGNTGRCVCYPGLGVNLTNLECIPCVHDCLGFNVYFMPSSTQSLFLLSFSSPTVQLIPIQQNLRIYVNNNFTANISYQIKQIKSNFYEIIVDNEGLTPCQTNCQINFTFIKPWLILKQNKNQALTQNTQPLWIENYYNVGDKIPNEVNQIFAIISLVVGATSGGGLSNVLKMLFELQQLIEFHKYMSMELPLIFKEFIESLSIFKFLDVTALFPFNVNAYLETLSTSYFDTKGPIKNIYYDQGANFYKNIIPVLLSFGIVIGLNFSLFFIFRVIPFKFSWNLSEKLRVRRIITFSDMLQTLILPTIVYANVQLFIIYYKIDMIWIYILTVVVTLVILSLPFFVIAYVFANRHKHQTQDVFFDLMQDCHLNYSATYVFYVFTFYRKVLFGMLLFDMIPMQIQGYAILFINTCYLGMICYIVYRRIFLSRIKIFTRVLNAVCVIAIEVIMIYYNSGTHSIQMMVDLGASCVYLAIVSTIIGVVEAFIKLFEIIYQKIYQSKVKVGEKNDGIKRSRRKKYPHIEQNIIKSMHSKEVDISIQKITSINSKDTLETIDSELSDKMSVWTRPKRKLKFLTHLLTRHNNSNSNKLPNIASVELQHPQQQSFEKMRNQQQTSDIMSMKSNDEFRNQRKNNKKLINISGKRIQKADGSSRFYKNDGSNLSYEKMSDMAKRFNSIEESSKIERKRPTSLNNNDSELVQLTASRRSEKRTKRKNQDDNLHSKTRQNSSYNNN